MLGRDGGQPASEMRFCGSERNKQGGVQTVMLWRGVRTETCCDTFPGTLPSLGTVGIWRTPWKASMGAVGEPGSGHGLAGSAKSSWPLWKAAVEVEVEGRQP